MQRPLGATAIAAVLLTSSFLVALAPPATADGHADERTCAASMDVLFLFDTTGSMGSAITSAQSGAAQIMQNVASQVQGVRFGVADYRDYPGYFSYPGYASTYGGQTDYPWQLIQPFTTSLTDVQTGINTLFASGGSDYPEALTRALWESSQLAWDPSAARLVVLFADAPGHDDDITGTNWGGDPGPDGIALTADDLDAQTVLASMMAADIPVAVVDYGGPSAGLDQIALLSGGSHSPASGNFVNQVTQTILAFAPDTDVYGTSYTVSVRTDTPLGAVDIGPLAPSDAKTNTNGMIDQHAFDINGYQLHVRAGDHQASSTTAPIVNAATNVTIAAVDLFDPNGVPVLQARALQAWADAWATTTASGASASTQIASLDIMGIQMAVDGAQQSYSTPFGTVTLFASATFGGGSTTSAAGRATILEIDLDTRAGVSTHIIIGRAEAAATCGGPLLIGPPEDPTTPGLPVGGLDPIVDGLIGGAMTVQPRPPSSRR